MTNVPSKTQGSGQRDRTLRGVQTALNASDIPRAIALAKAAVADGVEDPLFFNLMSHELEEQGLYREALAHLQRAYDLAPRDVLIINAIGLNMMHQRRTDEAIKLYDVALSIEPNLPQSHYNKGEALAVQGDFPGARRCYERAVAIYPNYAEALAGLAWLAIRRTDVAEAGTLAERALAQDKGQHVAALVLAEIEIGEGAVDAAERRLAEVLGQPDLKPLIHANASSLMGDVLDARGEAAGAFAAYTASGGELQRHHAQQYAAEGAPTVLDMARWLTEYFEAADPADWLTGPAAPPPAPDEPARHVFLVGFPRSGTTLLEQILASHPEVVTLDEREILIDSFNDLFVTDEALDRLSKLDADQATQYRQSYWRRAREYHPDLGGKVFIDKLPLNSVQAPLIAKLFPDAKFLFARRDPRDVVLSCFRRRFGMNPAMYQLLTLDGAARYYDAVMRLSEVYKAKLSIDIHEVRYESLVADLQAEAQAVCDFIGIEFDAAMLDFAQTARSRSIRTPSAKQVRRGLYQEGVAQWPAYRADLAPVMPLLQPWVDAFGYPTA